MTEPEIKAIAKLELKAGDILVVFIPKDRIAAVARNVMATSEHLLPPGVKTIIAEVGMDMKVLHPEGS